MGIAAGVLLAAAGGAAARAAEGGEAVPPAEAATPPAEGRTSLSRVLRAAGRRTVVWAAARTVQPMFGFCRGPLKRLLPSSHYLPSPLARREHDDYLIPGLSLMPRAWTTFDWGKPRMILGNQKQNLAGDPKPIGERDLSNCRSIRTFRRLFAGFRPISPSPFPTGCISASAPAGMSGLLYGCPVGRRQDGGRIMVSL